MENNTFKYEVFKKTFYLILLIIVLISLIMILLGFVNEYSTHKNCLINSGIWDKQNSICGFLIIYGNNLELRKIVTD